MAPIKIDKAHMGVMGAEEDNVDGKIPAEGVFGDAVTEGNHFKMETS